MATRLGALGEEGEGRLDTGHQAGLLRDQQLAKLLARVSLLHPCQQPELPSQNVTCLSEIFGLELIGEPPKCVSGRLLASIWVKHWHFARTIDIMTVKVAIYLRFSISDRTADGKRGRQIYL